MQCPDCHHENNPDANFCEHCGARQQRRCQNCEHTLSAEANFCANCGTPTDRAVPPSPAPDTAAVHDRRTQDYTPRHLAEKILSSRSALEGERKHVTVLFADIHGSMTMSEHLDPEAWHQIMDRFFAIMAEGIHRFEGTINQYTGDGVMALFGAPLAHEDHAHRACYAALHLQETLRQYANELRVEQGIPVAVRIGLNSGEVVVGRIGDDLRMDYTAQGHTVGLAARMQQIAEPGRTALTGATEALIKGYFALESLGESAVKGVSDPVAIYALDGLGEMRTRLDVSRSRGLSKFIGRQQEMETLESALTQIQSGQGQIVGVVADAGTGKSRLCEEFLQHCEGRGITAYRTYCLPHGRALPLFPVMQLYRSVFGLADNDSPQQARDKIAGRMVLMDKSFVDTLPLLFDFLGVADPDENSNVADPEEQTRRIIEVLQRFTLARGEREPIVVLMEDLHWMDPGSAYFLDRLIEVVPGGRVLLIANFRPEYIGNWTQKSYYRQIALHPLGETEIDALLEHLLGSDTTLARLPRQIAEQTGGNPFFVEEVVRELEASGWIEGSTGQYTLAHADAQIPLPTSVHAVLAARIDRLDDEAKQTLQSASAIGREFSLKMLSAISELDAARLESLLAVLATNEFIYPRSLFPEPVYMFKHALTRDVAYGSLLVDRRRQLHAKLGALLEGTESETDRAIGSESSALIAHHYDEAGDVKNGAIWHERAASWIGLKNTAESVTHLARVRELLEQLDKTPENCAWHVRVTCTEISRSLRGRVALDIPARLRDARSSLELCQDPHAEARILTTEGSLHYLKGDFNTAAPILDAALNKARSTGNAHTIGAALPFWLVTKVFTDPRAVVELANTLGEFNVDGISETIGFRAHGWSRSHVAMSLTMLGRYGEAMAVIEKAMDAARVGNDPVDLSMTIGFAAMCHSMFGEEKRAIASMRAARRNGESCGVPIAIATPCMTPAMTPDPCHSSLSISERESIHKRLAQLGLGFMSSNEQLQGAHIELAKGNLEAALAQSREAAHTIESNGLSIVQPLAAVVEAECHLALSGAAASDAIEACLNRVEAVIEQLGVEIYRPYVHRMRAKLAQLSGDTMGIEHELAAAAAAIAASGAPIPDGF